MNEAAVRNVFRRLLEAYEIRLCADIDSDHPFAPIWQYNADQEIDRFRAEFEAAMAEEEGQCGTTK